MALPQQPGRGAFPSPRHRTQNRRQLFRRVLRKRLVGLGFIGVQNLAQRIRATVFDIVKHIRIQPRHMHRIRLHKPQIERRCPISPQTVAQVNVARVIHADVQDRTRTAPIRVL